MGADDHLPQRIVVTDRLAGIHRDTLQQLQHDRNPCRIDATFRLIDAQHPPRLRVVGQDQ